MAINKEESTRVNIKLSNELVSKLDEIAKSYGMSRSGLCAYMVGRSVDMESRLREIMLSAPGISSMLSSIKPASDE